MPEGRSESPVRVHITAQRRADDIETALSRKGIQVFHCPSIVTTPVLDDRDLAETTRNIVGERPGLLVVTTGVGFRGWMSAADHAGLKGDLLAALGSARILARGAKAHGAVASEGLPVEWVSQEETADDVAQYLVGEDLSGISAVVQHHGMGSDGLDGRIRSLGAVVTPVVTYRYAETAETSAIGNSIADALGGDRVGVVFTSAGGAAAWLRHVPADCLERLRGLSSAGSTGLFAVGSVTAQPLVDAGLTVKLPNRFRLGSLLRTVSEWATESPEHERTSS